MAELLVPVAVLLVVLAFLYRDNQSKDREIRRLTAALLHKDREPVAAQTVMAPELASLNAQKPVFEGAQKPLGL